MFSLNGATIIGNLTRDPELRSTPSGTSVCSFGIATNRSWKDQQGQKQEEVEYHSVVAWGKLAEICSQYLGKGKKVYVEGRLRTRDWEGQDGAKRTRTEIIIENMIMLSGPGGTGSGTHAGNGHDTVQAAPTAQNGGLEEIQVEDIPF